MKQNSGKIQAVFLYGIFLFYIYLLLCLTLFKYVSVTELFDTGRRIERGVNLYPFATIKEYLTGDANVSQTLAFHNVVGNIALFIPLGVYLQLFKKKKQIGYSILIVILASVAIEVTQYIFGLGAMDIDDILLNGFGGIIGVLLYKCISAVIPDSAKIRTVVTVCSSIAGIPVMVLAVLVAFANGH
ncbi:VanZ family protein [Konateibacter massiliensis]|uniref:VanZ family protein n=1 Tax=Konateibacter massiliensis TaxID=2002841 RepID=UPI000C155588|nr:VanZ family protein [Konateibacter massiliensis]